MTLPRVPHGAPPARWYCGRCARALPDGALSCECGHVGPERTPPWCTTHARRWEPRAPGCSALGTDGEDCARGVPTYVGDPPRPDPARCVLAVDALALLTLEARRAG